MSSPIFPVNVDIDRAAVSHSNHRAAAFMHRLGQEVWAVAGPLWDADLWMWC